MKYHTISTSSLASEGKKSTLTIYTDPDFVSDKMESSNEALIRCELEMAQRALKYQTSRCRHLVAEFTRKLQAKELEIISERQLRDEQLSRVLRSLLVFEARLRQEQTFIRHQLGEKDEHIQRQRKELRRLRFAVQLCKTCSQYGGNVDSCDSGSEYCPASQESGSELYASLSECGKQETSSGEDIKNKVTYEKNKTKNTDSLKRTKKTNGRRTTGTYFEVLKLRESSADSSQDDVSISDGDGKTENIEEVSERIEELFSESSAASDTFSERMDSLHGIKKISVASIEENRNEMSPSEVKRIESQFKTPDVVADATKSDNDRLNKATLITDTIPVFDAGDGTSNDNWYASASDPEDDEQSDIYRNNPVLECMNQILLKNINDSIHSPPKSPELDRTTKNKSMKRVKFSDENNETPAKVEEEKEPSIHTDYYETPIQVANFYEVPQSIYSNDYEQIFNKSGESIQNWSPTKINSSSSKMENLQEKKINRMSSQKLTIAKSNNESLESKNHYYVDMDTKCTSPVQNPEIVKKTKVNRTPPALPPKPANLVSKLKMQTALRNGRSCENLDSFSLESEPDYCSISELNLPTEKMLMSKSSAQNLSESQISLPLYDLISLDGTLSSLAMKNAEKNNLQCSKPTQIKTERVVSNVANISQISMLKNRKEPEIPKLPQVSEIIIPDENEESDKKEDRIAQDNYIKNNSQLLKQKPNSSEKLRGPIIIGSSVSSLISGFNQHLLSEIGSRDKRKERLFSSFDKQNYEKQVPEPLEPPNFEKFDLSQNFEEFKLDDCEIGEEFNAESNSLNGDVDAQNNEKELIKNITNRPKSQSSVEIVRATKPSPHNIQTIQQLQKNLTIQKNNVSTNDVPRTPVITPSSEASYEHFLECTGLSSKSILTPSRMLSNHKSMLKPKDIKLRSKVRSTTIFEHSGNTVKYWSEPYL